MLSLSTICQNNNDGCVSSWRRRWKSSWNHFFFFEIVLKVRKVLLPKTVFALSSESGNRGIPSRKFFCTYVLQSFATIFFLLKVILHPFFNSPSIFHLAAFLFSSTRRFEQRSFIESNQIQSLGTKRFILLSLVPSLVLGSFLLI